jgi:hypothetical protein
VQRASGGQANKSREQESKSSGSGERRA